MSSREQQSAYDNALQESRRHQLKLAVVREKYLLHPNTHEPTRLSAGDADHLGLAEIARRPSTDTAQRRISHIPMSSRRVNSSNDRKASTTTYASTLSTASLNSRGDQASSSWAMGDQIRKLSAAGSNVYRKVSAVVVPSSQRITGFEGLIAKKKLLITIDSQLEFDRAMRQASMSTVFYFDPVRFWVRCVEERTILYAVEICPSEIVIKDLTPQQNRLLSFSVPKGFKGNGFQMGKIKNASGFKLFTLINRPQSNIVDIQRVSQDNDRLPFLRVDESINYILACLGCCGLAFDAGVHTVKSAGGQKHIAKITSGIGASRQMYIDFWQTELASAPLNENSAALNSSGGDDMNEQEIRAVSLLYAVFIMIGSAYPGLSTSMMQHRHCKKHDGSLDEE